VIVWDARVGSHYRGTAAAHVVAVVVGISVCCCPGSSVLEVTYYRGMAAAHVVVAVVVVGISVYCCSGCSVLEMLYDFALVPRKHPRPKTAVPPWRPQLMGSPKIHNFALIPMKHPRPKPAVPPRRPKLMGSAKIHASKVFYRRRQQSYYWNSNID
jgi:hypothetical protein